MISQSLSKNLANRQKCQQQTFAVLSLWTFYFYFHFLTDRNKNDHNIHEMKNMSVYSLYLSLSDQTSNNKGDIDRDILTFVSFCIVFYNPLSTSQTLPPLITIRLSRLYITYAQDFAALWCYLVCVLGQEKYSRALETDSMKENKSIYTTKKESTFPVNLSMLASFIIDFQPKKISST